MIFYNCILISLDGRASKLEIFGLLSGAVPFAFRSDSNNSMDSYIGRTVKN